MRKVFLEKKGFKWINTYYECDDYIILNCSKEETNESYDVLIDKEDFELVSKGQWHVVVQQEKKSHKKCYSVIWSTTLNNKRVNYNIYQLILKTKLSNNGLIVDHINMDRFDNRKKNLRITTYKVNSINQIHNGYNFDKDTNKYLVRITIGEKCINIGRYNTIEEANEIYLKASIIIGKDKISSDIKNRIDELNIILTNEEIKLNKYLYKVYCIYNNIEVPKKLNGKLKLEYEKNIDIIDKLYKNGYSWNYIANYLMDNNLQEKAKGETIKKYYLKYLKDNNYSDDYINNIKNKTNKIKIKCLTHNKTFESVKEAYEFYNISHHIWDKIKKHKNCIFEYGGLQWQLI